MANNLIKDKHNTLFKSKITDLMEDIGRVITVETRSDSVECEWCYKDIASNRSSGVPKPGKDWSTHPNYYGSDIRCPQCNGSYFINEPNTTLVSGVIIEDVTPGLNYTYGKISMMPDGRKNLIGKLELILIDTSDVNSETVFDRSTNIIVDGTDYRIKSISRLGLKDLYLFDVIVEKFDPIKGSQDAI